MTQSSDFGEYTLVRYSPPSLLLWTLGYMQVIHMPTYSLIIVELKFKELKTLSNPKAADTNSTWYKISKGTCKGDLQIR